MTLTVLQGDCRSVLPTLDAGSVQTCTTSPPYWSLRDYQCEGQIGLEDTPEEYVANLVAVFREVRRVLRDDGTCWVNLGDAYAQDAKWGGASGNKNYTSTAGGYSRARKHTGLKPKDLIGLPWMVAFALRADGWYLRQEIIWHKPNGMPERVSDRPTRSHEQIFLLSKAPYYFYDAEAIKEPSSPSSEARAKYNGGKPSPKAYAGTEAGVFCGPPSTAKAYGQGRNKRSVWTVATQPFSGAHFATFPEKLIEPCILAGSAPQACEVCGAPWQRVVERERIAPASPSGWRENGRWNEDGRGSGDLDRTRSVTLGWQLSCACPDATGTGKSVVLDPFFGSGTVGRVALRHGRACIGIELNADYLQQVEQRTAAVQMSMESML